MTRSILAAAIVAVAGASAARPTQSSPAVDVITEWSVAASAAVPASGMAPLRGPITFAILHLAMYDAVHAVTGSRAPYAVRPPVTRPASASAAAVEAGYRVLLAEFPTERAALTTVYDRLLAHEPDRLAATNGSDVGRRVAAEMLAVRMTDGRNEHLPYTPPPGTGAWVPTPPGFLNATSAFLARVTPFTMESASQFRPAGPPSFGSQQWVREYEEVRTLGSSSSSARTPAQTATAWFWEPLAGTVWPATIRRLAREQALDLPGSAHFQAAAFAAFADGLIACWEAKFHFNTWRPVTAIQRGDADGNPLTRPDAAWTPLAVTPNFPEYPSGHACATAAVAHTIEDYFPHDVLIPARNVVSGEERFYGKASEAVDEVVEARMLLGLHFRSGDEDGADIGRRIARQIRSRWFKKSGT